MNTTVVTSKTSETFESKHSSILNEVLFFVKTSVVMSAVVLLLASAWV
jgi:hypothetical protein